MFWILIILAVLFAGLALDARELSVPWKDTPYSVTAAQDVSHLSLVEQEKRKAWHAQHGTGDASQAHIFWGLLSLGCAIGAVVDLLD